MAKQEQIGDVPGNVLGMLADLNHKLQHGNISPRQLERYLKKENPFESTVTEKHTILQVTVNRDRTIADGVAAGKYNWSNVDITDANFPRCGAGTESSEIVLVHFEKSMSTDNVLKELEECDLRPADIQELLAVGEQYPDMQREFPIIALGSVWQLQDGHQFVPFLFGVGSDRRLDLRWIVSDWVDNCRFAAVRK